MQSLLIIFLLFFLPLVVLPFGTSYFETPKVIIAEILIEVLLFLSLLKFKTLVLERKRVILTAGLILLSVIYLLFNPNAEVFFGNAFRLQGIFLLWHLWLLSLVTQNFQLRVWPGVPLISLILLLVMTLFFGEVSFRRFGSLGEPNSLAAAALFLAPWTLHFKAKYLKILGLLLAGIIIFLSGSRSGLIGLLLQLIILVLLFFKLSLKKAILVSLLLLVLSWLTPFFGYLSPSQQLRQGLWVENRSLIWITALNSSLNSPLWGSGFGNLTPAIKESAQKLNNGVQYQFVDSSHNLFLDYWVQGGILGLGCLLGLIYLGFYRLVKEQKLELLLSLIGILTVASFNPLSVAVLVQFWLLLGLL